MESIPSALDPYVDDPDLEPARRSMGHTLTYANEVDLVAMTPRGDLAGTGHCLASPGSEYLAYQPNSGSTFTVDLDVGTYLYEWFNPMTGDVASSGTVSAGGGDKSFTAPFSGDAVLYLKRAP